MKHIIFQYKRSAPQDALALEHSFRAGPVCTVLPPATPFGIWAQPRAAPTDRRECTPRAGFFLILGPPGGAGCLPTHYPRGGPKMAQMAGAARKFLYRFDTNTEEKREKCLPSAGPPPGSQKVWVPGHRWDRSLKEA